MSTQDSAQLDPLADTLADGFDDDWDVAPPPRRRLHWTTAVLIVALIVVAAFAGGIFAQKHWGGSSSSGFTLPNGGSLPAGFPGAATGGAGSNGAGSGSTERPPRRPRTRRLRRRHPRHRQLRRRKHPLRLDRVRQCRQGTHPQRAHGRPHCDCKGIVDSAGRDGRRPGCSGDERNREGNRSHRDRWLGITGPIKPVVEKLVVGRFRAWSVVM